MILRILRERERTGVSPFPLPTVLSWAFHVTLISQILVDFLVGLRVVGFLHPWHGRIVGTRGLTHVVWESYG